MFKPGRTTLAALLLSSFISAAVVAEPGEEPAWPQWRGPTRDGQVAGADWPAKLNDEHLRQAWSVELQPSYSGPIVTADRVFVTETVDETHEVVRALDRATGKPIWEARWEGSLTVPFFAAANGSWIRATPCLDGDRLYVAGIRDLLVCLDATNGKEIWKVDFVAQSESPVPSFGFVASPLVVEDHLYVQAGGGFAKLNKATGEILWHVLKDGGGMLGSAFSSPVYATLGGQPQLVVQTRSKLAGIDLDGNVLWSQEVPAFRGMNILTPTILGDSIFTSSYGGRSTLYHVARTDGNWQVTDQWTHKSQGYMSSPVVIDGHIYLHLRNQRFLCLDAASGEECWTTKPFGKYWSMVASGNQILALDERGELLLIEASPEEFKLLDRRMVAENAWAHLAVVGKQVFVRDLRAMKVFEWRKPD